MKVGFTGTRNGMTPKQYTEVRSWLSVERPIEVHHGDCIGADAQFHKICEELGISIVIHPPTSPRLRAFCIALHNEPAKPYLERNRDIVDDVDTLIATPDSSVERSNSGTWYTINYSLNSRKSTVIIYP